MLARVQSVTIIYTLAFLGSVNSSNKELRQELELDCETSRTALLGLKAAKEAAEKEKGIEPSGN